MYPLPGVNLDALSNLFTNIPLLGMAGYVSAVGALRRFVLLLWAFTPYITSSIIITILQPVIPQLQALALEGESGRNKINQITHLVNRSLAALQGYGQIAYLRSQGVISANQPVDYNYYGSLE